MSTKARLPKGHLLSQPPAGCGLPAVCLLPVCNRNSVAEIAPWESMLFNSYPFLLGFLPFSLIGVAALRHRTNSRIVFILAVSLFFYAWWDWRLLPMLV